MPEHIPYRSYVELNAPECLLLPVGVGGLKRVENGLRGNVVSRSFGLFPYVRWADGSEGPCRPLVLLGKSGGRPETPPAPRIWSRDDFVEAHRIAKGTLGEDYVRAACRVLAHAELHARIVVPQPRDEKGHFVKRPKLAAGDEKL